MIHPLMHEQNIYIQYIYSFIYSDCSYLYFCCFLSLSGFIISVLRYLQLRDTIDKRWLNISSLVLFSLGSFGLTLVGNFQVISTTDRYVYFNIKFNLYANLSMDSAAVSVPETWQIKSELIVICIICVSVIQWRDDSQLWHLDDVRTGNAVLLGSVLYHPEG